MPKTTVDRAAAATPLGLVLVLGGLAAAFLGRLFPLEVGGLAAVAFGIVLLARGRPPKPSRAMGMWVVVGLLATAVGAHMVSSAHPTRTAKVIGQVTGYQANPPSSGDVSEGTSGTLDIDGVTYLVADISSYTPAIDSFQDLVGVRIVAYVDTDTNEVEAFSNLQDEQLHATEAYRNPSSQWLLELILASIVTVAGIVAATVGSLAKA